MTCWVVIPVKPVSAAKGRLAEALPAEQREHLARAMLKRVLQAVSQAHVDIRLALAGGDATGLPRGAILLPDHGDGLNATLDSARSALGALGAQRIVTIAADLPLLQPGDVEALCTLPAGTAGIAPDRHGAGTNALSLPLPEAASFAYGYGTGSRQRHEAEADRLGLECRVIKTTGLERDIDEPADLADVKDLLAEWEGQA